MAACGGHSPSLSPSFMADEKGCYNSVSKVILILKVQFKIKINNGHLQRSFIHEITIKRISSSCYVNLRSKI